MGIPSTTIYYPALRSGFFLFLLESVCFDRKSSRRLRNTEKVNHAGNDIICLPDDLFSQLFNQTPLIIIIKIFLAVFARKQNTKPIHLWRKAKMSRAVESYASVNINAVSLLFSKTWKSRVDHLKAIWDHSCGLTLQLSWDHVHSLSALTELMMLAIKAQVSMDSTWGSALLRTQTPLIRA